MSPMRPKDTLELTAADRELSLYLRKTNFDCSSSQLSLRETKR